MIDRNNLSRRDFIRAGALGITGLVSGGIMGCQKSAGRKAVPVGVQLYSVRHDCAGDLPGTLEKVAKMGYDGVEFADYYERSSAELRKMLDDNGLKCCGTHIYLETLLGDELEKTVEFNKTLGNRYLIVRWLDERQYNTREKWLALCETVNRIAANLKPHGMRVGYHNHGYEFKPMEGELPWDIFADHTVKDVILQLDTGNCSHTGADPLHFLRRNPGRSGTVHLKPFSTANPKALIGDDEIDWNQVFDVCESTGGVEWYIIEYEVEGIPPLDAIRMNLERFRKLRTA